MSDHHREVLENDSEKGLLTGALTRNHGDGQGTMRWTVWITCLNMTVLCASIIFLMSPLSSRACLQHLSDNDKWKATSAYGKYTLIPQF